MEISVENLHRYAAEDSEESPIEHASEAVALAHHRAEQKHPMRSLIHKLAPVQSGKAT